MTSCILAVFTEIRKFNLQGEIQRYDVSFAIYLMTIYLLNSVAGLAGTATVPTT